MNKKRIFVSASIADSMFSLMDKGKLEFTNSSIEELVALDSDPEVTLISVLKSEALLNTLNLKYGLKLEQNPVKIQLQPGDRLYVLNCGPSLLTTEEFLPEWATITVKCFTVIED